jgi:hypothetical protein
MDGPSSSSLQLLSASTAATAVAVTTSSGLVRGIPTSILRFGLPYEIEPGRGESGRI